MRANVQLILIRVGTGQLGGGYNDRKCATTSTTYRETAVHGDRASNSGADVHGLRVGHNWVECNQMQSDAIESTCALCVCARALCALCVCFVRVLCACALCVYFVREPCACAVLL